MTPDQSLTVAVAYDRKDIEKAIASALGELALEDFKDKLVAIHPNDTTATAKDKTACTQVDSLRATIRSIKALRPKSIVITGGAGAMETADVFKVMGYMEVIESEGVEW